MASSPASAAVWRRAISRRIWSLSRSTICGLAALSPGERVVVEAVGCGLALTDWPDIALFNTSPRLLDALPIKQDHAPGGRLSARSCRRGSPGPGSARTPGSAISRSPPPRRIDGSVERPPLRRPGRVRRHRRPRRALLAPGTRRDRPGRPRTQPCARPRTRHHGASVRSCAQPLAEDGGGNRCGHAHAALERPLTEGLMEGALVRSRVGRPASGCLSAKGSIRNKL